MERSLTQVASAVVALAILCCSGSASAASWLAIGDAVSAAESRPAPPDGPPATIDYNTFLKGRYSFRLDGWDASELDASPLPVSFVGSIVFDGQGGVESVKFFRTRNGSTERLGRDTDGWRFESGTYTVNNTEVGHVTLDFVEIPPIGQRVYDVDLTWDIALTNGGKGFYVNVHSLTRELAGGNDKLTANGQAAQE